MLSRSDERMMSEPELQEKARDLMSRYKYTFVLCSSTDLDRLASFYLATAGCTGRLFIADGYQRKLLTLFTDTLGRKIKEYDFSKACEYSEALLPDMLESGFTMLVRVSNKFKEWIKGLMPSLATEQTALIYSQFKGYINSEHKVYNAGTDGFVKSYDWNFEYLHTSGHASKEALTKVCNTVNPRSAIIPIHKEAGSDFTSLDISEELKNKVVTSDTIVDDIEIKVTF